MTDLLTRLRDGLNSLGGIIPAAVVALIILLAGYLLAKQIERFTDGLLDRLDFNRAAERSGLSGQLGQAGRGVDPVRAVGRLIFWLMMLMVIFLSSAAFGLDRLSEMFVMMLNFIPTLVAGIVIIILGIILGEFLRGLILASAGAVDGVNTLAKLAKAAVVLIAVFMAIQQIGVAEEIVTTAFTLILGSVALAAGLAFGLGNRELAGEITRRWYEAGRNRKGPVEKKSFEEDARG
jgi:mechanosensitive ion channel-like protein